MYELQLPETMTVLRVARLRYLGQLVSHGLPPVWAMLQQTPAWLAQSNDDLRWLLTYCPEARWQTGLLNSQHGGNVC